MTTTGDVRAWRAGVGKGEQVTVHHVRWSIDAWLEARTEGAAR